MTALQYDEFVPCKYETQKDLLDRLDGTICKYNGEPVFVSHYQDDQLNIYPMVGKQTNPIKTIKASDPRFDISMTECMYMNFVYDEKALRRGIDKNPNQAVYLSRNPSKYWKQGFYISYSIIRAIDGGNDIPDRGYVNRSQGMYDAFVGKYPSFEEVFSTFLNVKLGEEAEVAISRDIALKKSQVGVVFVYYRTEMVGWMEPGSTKIKVVESDLGWVIERYLKRLSII